MTLEELRAKHPRFIYKNYHIDQTSENLVLTFEFLLEPTTIFHHQVTIPYLGSAKTPELESLVFHLGMVEMISYWKAACSPEIVIETGFLGQEQLTFWQKLLTHGLGEFFYQNSIDFSVPGFVRFMAAHNEGEVIPSHDSMVNGKYTHDLVLLGGGEGFCSNSGTIGSNVPHRGISG